MFTFFVWSHTITTSKVIISGTLCKLKPTMIMTNNVTLCQMNGANSTMITSVILNFLKFNCFGLCVVSERFLLVSSFLQSFLCSIKRVLKLLDICDVLSHSGDFRLDFVSEVFHVFKGLS